MNPAKGWVHPSYVAGFTHNEIDTCQLKICLAIHTVKLNHLHATHHLNYFRFLCKHTYTYGWECPLTRVPVMPHGHGQTLVSDRGHLKGTFHWPKKPRMERGTFKPSYVRVSFRLVCAFPLGSPFKPQTKSTVCEYFLPPLRRDPWISEPGRYHRHRPPEHGRKKWTRFHRAARFKGWQHLEISTCQKLKLRFG